MEQKKGIKKEQKGTKKTKFNSLWVHFKPISDLLQAQLRMTNEGGSEIRKS